MERTIYFATHRSDSNTCVAARMGMDDYIEFTMSKEDHQTFLQYMKDRASGFKWEELQDSMDKAWFAVSVGIIRKLTPDFMEQYSEARVHLNYIEAAVLNRMVKIIQIEIGEENDDQQMFQQIASELFHLL